jgi:hypothetical protein
MTKPDVMAMDWFRELLAEVQKEYVRLHERQKGQQPALDEARVQLQQKVQGWSQSLAKADLGPLVRQAMEKEYQATLERIAEIESAINVRTAETQQLRVVVDPTVVAERLDRLADVLANANPSMANIELAHHIDRIDCFDDGRVVLRMCRLGALTDAVDLLSRAEADSVTDSSGTEDPDQDKVTPRRLTRRRIDTGEAVTEDLKARAAWAADPNRFARLDDRWFEEQVFQVPHRLSWAEANALEVGALRKKGLTEERLAKHFRVSLPTIRKSLRFAREKDSSLGELPRRMPRPRWHEEFAIEVARLKATGMGTNDLVRHCHKSDVTIRKALEYAKIIAQQNGSNAGHALSASPPPGD